MTRESKLRVKMVLGVLSLSMLFVAGLKRNSDHDQISLIEKSLKPTTPSFCAQYTDSSSPSRSIASGDESEEAKTEKDLEQLCENENRIATLKAELDELQEKRDETIALLERVQKKLEEEKDEDKKDKKKKKKIKIEDKDQAMLLLLANRYSMMQQQASMAAQFSFAMPAPMGEAYSPLHNRTSKQNMDYLQMALMHRVNFSMQEDHYWHPEWNAQGQMTNPIYGTPNTWQNIESMFRDPVGSNVFTVPNQNTPMSLYHNRPSNLFY